MLRQLRFAPLVGRVFASALTAAVLAIPVGAPAGAAAASTPVQGRPLAVVLDELRLQGLDLIYSSALVTPDLVVTVEPSARRPRTRLDEILEPLGLAAKNGPGRSILIVPALSGRVRGRVCSERDGAAIPGATVRVEGRPESAPSRPDGSFELGALPAGEYTLVATAPSFLERRVEGVTVRPGRGRGLEIPLRPQPGFVEEITVTPGRTALIQEEQADGLAVSRDDALLVPSIGGDASRVIEGLPGVTAADNSAAFSVRGSEARDVSFVLDGLELYEPFHLTAFQSPFSFLDSEVVDRMDLVRGGFTAETGDRHGGIVRLSSRLPGEEERTGVELGTVKTRVAHARAGAEGSFLVSGRAWYPEALGAVDFGEDELDPRFQDLYLKGTRYLSPRTILSGHLLLARDRVDFQESDGAEQVDEGNDSGHVWLRALRSWSDAVFSETIVSGGWLRQARSGIAEPGDEPLAVDDEREVNFVGLRHDMTWENGGAHLVRAGLEIRPLAARYRYTFGPQDAPATTRLDPSGTSYGLHAAYRAVLNDRLATEIGLRWDRQTYVGDHQLSPRLHALWRLGERSELRVGAGLYSQSQRIYELRLEDGETEFRPAERSRQANVTFQHRFAGGFQLRCDAYLRRLSDVHPRSENLFSPIELFPEAEDDRVTVAPERTRAHGLEVLLQGPPGRPFSWWASYARSLVEDRIDGRDVPRSRDQTHAGNFLTTWRWGRGWSVSLSGTVHTGWPTTPMFGEIVTQPDGSTQVEPVLGPRNSERFATYARLDARLGRTLDRSASRLRLELHVANVTARDNECCVDEFIFTPQPDGSVVTDAVVDYWRGFTTSASALWRF